MSTTAVNQLESALSTLPDPGKRPILLPLTHVSSAEHFDSIVSAGRLVPRGCKVFHKDLTYLFYGGVFYRPKSRATRKVTELPIGFVFSPTTLDKIYRLFPFDTGALEDKRYGTWDGTLRPFEKFELPCSGRTDMLSKLVHYVFGSNEQYLKGDPDPLCKSGPDPIPQLYDFYTDDLTPGGVDHRQCIIEGQASVEIPLDRDLLWVGFPESMTPEFEKLYEWTKPWVPQYYPYASHMIKNPAEYAAKLEEIARREVIGRYIKLP